MVRGTHRDNAAEGAPGTLAAMGAWYWIGVSVGLGAAAGVLVAGFAARVVLAAVVLAAAIGLGLGYAIDAWQPGSWGDLVGGAAGGLAGALGASQIVRGALRRGGTAGGTAALVARRRARRSRARVRSRLSAISRRSRCPCSRLVSAAARRSGTPGCARSRSDGKKLVLIVVDGMTPAAFERAVESGRAPALARLAEQARIVVRRLSSRRSRPSASRRSRPARGLTCTTSRTSSGGIGEERRIVEYGSSFAALRAAGMAQSITDTIFNMNAEHLGRDAVTVYEALEDTGLVAAAVNITCYRGPHEAPARRCRG